MTNVDEFAFYNCDITSMTIPEAVTVIGNHAFDGCFKLESIDIPAGVTRIGEGAFYNCKLLAGPLAIPSGGTPVSAATVVTGNATYYAQWTEAPVASSFAAWAAANGITGAFSEFAGRVAEAAQTA